MASKNFNYFAIRSSTYIANDDNIGTIGGVGNVGTIGDIGNVDENSIFADILTTPDCRKGMLESRYWIQKASKHSLYEGRLS